MRRGNAAVNSGRQVRWRMPIRRSLFGEFARGAKHSAAGMGIKLIPGGQA